MINVAGQIVAINPVDLGSGYTSAGKVKIVDSNDGPGQGATATCSQANGQITGYTVTAAGSGYLAPVVAVTGGGVDVTDLNYVQDQDVNKAITQTMVNFNQGLWGNPGNPEDQAVFNAAFLAKAAHFLCLNLKASTQGLRGRGGEWLRNAFAVGDISSNYTIQETIGRSKILAPLMETTYGCLYLQMVSPRLVANVRSVIGWTKP